MPCTMPRRRVLVIDAALPDPARSAGDRSIVDLADGLVALGHAVTMFGFGVARPSRNDVDPADELRARGAAVESATGAAGLRGCLARIDADVVVVSRPGPAALAAPILVGHPEVLRLYWGHDLHGSRLRGQAAISDDVDPREIRMIELAERNAWAVADVSVYPSEAEAIAVRATLTGSRAVAFPYYRLVAADLVVDGAPHDDRDGLLMVGGATHAPNLDAVRWAAAQILPLTRAHPAARRITVVGEWPTDLRNEFGPDITFTGVITDDELRALHRTHLCLLAPLRFGAGVKRKIVAAMGLGLPVVTTSVGQHGLLVRDAGEDDGLSIGATPHELAIQVRALTDPDTWRTRAASAHRAVSATYGADSYDRDLERLLVARPSSPPR